ncbi:MAG: hypothetical protein E7498_05630 [Ruminococcus sp.]|nr:hypothetical protein [Ruminococcus sp.]
MNPLAALKIKNVLMSLNENHPKVLPFFKAAANVIDEGSVIEMTVTTSQGQRIVSNIRLTADDIEKFAELKGMI